MKQMYKFSESSKSRMEKFEESHAAREPQVGHPCTITFCSLRFVHYVHWRWSRKTEKLFL